MRILFYLPLARRWMLENVLEPLIAKLSSVAEVHVMIPTLWIKRGSTNTGLQAIASHRNVTWHPIEVGCGDLNAIDLNGPTPEIRDIASEIAPDYCLCRSANPSLSQHFPGQLRYIMEAGAPPFRLPPHWVSFQPQIFDHGLIPKLSPSQRDALLALITPCWQKLETAQPQDPSWLLRYKLPAHRKIIALPLEYDHPENLFGIHRSIRPNSALVAQLLNRIDPSLFVAATDHPLNIQFVDQRQLRATFSVYRDKACLLSPPVKGSDTTSIVTQLADGMIVGDSKSFAIAAFYGKPLLRISKFASGHWLRAYDDLGKFTADLAAECAMAPAREDAMLWFAHYLAAQVFAPSDANVTSIELLERITGDAGPDRWPERFARVAELP
jgi:hypothetical protein